MTDLKNHNLMKKLILKNLEKKYKIEDAIFSRHCMDGDLVVEIPVLRVKFSVLSNKVWTEVKKYVDTIIENICNKDKLTECPICCEMKSNIKFTGCSECYHRHCYECMGNVIRANQGLSVCPFCKHTIGYVMPQVMVEQFVNCLMEKINA